MEANSILYDRVSGEREHPDMVGVVHFDTFADSLLIVQINEDNAEYKIIDQDGTVLSNWTMPAVSNYQNGFFGNCMDFEYRSHYAFH